MLHRISIMERKIKKIETRCQEVIAKPQKDNHDLGQEKFAYDILEILKLS